MGQPINELPSRAATVKPLRNGEPIAASPDSELAQQFAAIQAVRAISRPVTYDEVNTWNGPLSPVLPGEEFDPRFLHIIDGRVFVDGVARQRVPLDQGRALTDDERLGEVRFAMRQLRTGSGISLPSEPGRIQKTNREPKPLIQNTSSTKPTLRESLSEIVENVGEHLPWSSRNGDPKKRSKVGPGSKSGRSRSRLHPWLRES